MSSDKWKEEGKELAGDFGEMWEGKSDKKATNYFSEMKTKKGRKGKKEFSKSKFGASAKRTISGGSFFQDVW